MGEVCIGALGGFASIAQKAFNSKQSVFEWCIVDKLLWTCDNHLSWALAIGNRNDGYPSWFYQADEQVQHALWFV